jgi:hypothetical protein
VTSNFVDEQLSGQWAWCCADAGWCDVEPGCEAAHNVSSNYNGWDYCDHSCPVKPPTRSAWEKLSFFLQRVAWAWTSETNDDEEQKEDELEMVTRLINSGDRRLKLDECEQALRIYQQARVAASNLGLEGADLVAEIDWKVFKAYKCLGMATLSLPPLDVSDDPTCGIDALADAELRYDFNIVTSSQGDGYILKSRIKHWTKWFELLQLNEACTNAEFKKSYRRLSKLYHPDKFDRAKFAAAEYCATQMSYILNSAKELFETVGLCQG